MYLIYISWDWDIIQGEEETIANSFLWGLTLEPEIAFVLEKCPKGKAGTLKYVLNFDNLVSLFPPNIVVDEYIL